MNKEVFVYNSSDGRSKISANIYTPAQGVVRGVVQLSHGMCEYVGRYEPFAKELCARGLVFCGNDHLGHRETALLNREKLGYFGELGARRFLVEDHELLRREVAGRYPGVPYFLMGHSMGSFVARLYAQRFGHELDGLILSGTAGKNPASGGGKALARALCATKGPKHVSQLVYNLADGSYAKAFPGDGRVGWLSRDQEVCRAYLKDSYCTFQFTVSAYYELFAMLEECSGKRWYAQMPKALPILIVSGDQDPVGNMGAGPKEVCQGLVAAGVGDVRLKLFENARHEPHNEVNKEEVYTAIFGWLDEMMAKNKQHC